jgi:outer membrane protein assembly factor BamB
MMALLKTYTSNRGDLHHWRAFFRVFSFLLAKIRIRIMPRLSTSELRNALQMGLAIVTEQWNGKAKDWVTGVHVADIDDDGDDEVIAASRDGRVRAFTRGGDLRWEYHIGSKVWVGTVVSTSASPDSPFSARIFVGTRDGKVCALNKDGKAVTPARRRTMLPSEEPTGEHALIDSSAWLTCEHVVRQVYTSSVGKPLLLIGSEDRHAYALDYATGDVHWRFPTKGWVRSVFLYDIDGDGETEALIGSVDNFLYVLDMHGQEKGRYDAGSPIRTLVAADIDEDGQVEILVGTDGNTLLALTPALTKKWKRHFGNFFHSLQVADIDNDGKYEIIASSEDKFLYFLDRRGIFIWRSNIGARIFSISIPHSGGEIFVGAEDNKVHALRVTLNKALCKSLRQAFQSYTGSLVKLPMTERTLLQDIVSLQKKSNSALTLQSIDELQQIQGEGQAVLDKLIELDQQKMQVLWSHTTSEHIRSLCVGNISGNEYNEIIVGTARGIIEAYTAGGRHLWSLSLAAYIRWATEARSQLLNQVSTLQVGLIHKKRWVEFLACTTDHIYTVRGVTTNISERTVRSKPEVVYTHNHATVDEWISSFCIHNLNSSNRQLLVGSEHKKIYVYGYSLDQILLDQTLQEIVTDQGVKIIHSAIIKPGSGDPEVIAGSINNQVDAYCQQEDGLWTRKWYYRTHDRIRALCSKDINHDGHIEIIVGSEDRNVHVLSSEGHLLWRYYLPQSVYAIDVGDIDKDGNDEIVVGCADSYLYIFSVKGDLLWRYCCGDCVRAVSIDYINYPNAIIVATERQVALIQVVERHELEQRMHACWLHQQQKKSATELISEFLTYASMHPNLCIFALYKIAEQPSLFHGDFSVFEKLLKDTGVDIRCATIHAIIALYPRDPLRVQPLLASVLKDVDPDVRLTFIQHIDRLMQYDSMLGFMYLEGLSRNADRFIRRAVVRLLHQLIEHQDSSYSLQKKIFTLLLVTINDEDSEWIRQESAVALSQLFNRLPGRFLYHLFSLVIQGVYPKILQHLAYNASKKQVRRVVSALASLLAPLDQENMLPRVTQVVEALEGTKGLLFGEDCWRIYSEMQRLLTFRAIHEIAYYRCSLPSEPFTRHNYHYITATRLFSRLSTVTHPLRGFLARNDLNDQLSSLLRAQGAIDILLQEVEKDYAQPVAGLPLFRLPDNALFRLLLNRWKSVIEERLYTISGKVVLETALITRTTFFEEEVAFCLDVSNKGYARANHIEVELLHNDNFRIIGKGSFEIEDLLANTETSLEFTIGPNPGASLLNLEFEIFIDEEEVPLRVRENLVLNSSSIPFQPIPNPYHTGIPQYSENMFFGREHDIEFLRNTLTQPDVQSMVVLYGQRRSGKTMLLLRLLNSADLAPHIPVFIDLQEVSYRDGDSGLFYKIALRITKAMIKRDFTLPKPEISYFNDNSRNAFDEFLDGIEALLGGQKIILMIDEFGCLGRQVEEGKVDLDIFEYLRSLIQHRRSLNFLLADIYKITQLTASYRSVFFNMALHHKLSKLRPDAAEKLIQQPVQQFLGYEPHVVHKIRQLTGDQPYLIHTVCRALIDLCNTKKKSSVALHDVNQACQGVALSIGSHYRAIWKQLVKLEKFILSVMAAATREDERGLLLLEIEEQLQNYRIPHQRNHLLASLKSLVDDDIIELVQEENHETSIEHTRYRIAVGLFRRWLCTENPPQQVLLEESIY